MNVRDVFFLSIFDECKSGRDIVVVSSDLGAPSLDEFRRIFPHRFVNVGIAEQNSISVAAGLAITGKTAVTYGLNPFPVTRGFDHIRNIMASLRIPITVVGLKAGTATAEAGFSHMVLENISLLRTLRNVQIVSPSDETISRKIVREIIDIPKPRYIQFDPYISGKLYNDDEVDFEKGFAITGRNEKVAVVSYGIWAHNIKKNFSGIKLLDCFSLPIDKKAFVNEIEKCDKIVTIEDGIDAGGIGSMTLEIMNDYGLCIPMKRLSLRFDEGYPSVFTDRGSIFETEGLTIDALKKEIMS